jgi:hypothetical protein
MDLISLAIPPLPEGTVQVERDQGADLCAVLLPELCSLAKALSILLSTHQLLSEFFDRASRRAERSVPV